MLSLGFTRRSRARRDVARELKSRALAHAALGEGDSLVVNEIQCFDAGCPGIETIILLLSPGAPTRACKIPKPMAEVTDEDLAQVLRSSA